MTPDNDCTFTFIYKNTDKYTYQCIYKFAYFLCISTFISTEERVFRFTYSYT